jgi:CheY-like chemotaxis protein
MENTGKTILFVEDNPFILAVYQNWLEREGFQVESAEDGLIALEKLPQMKPALVILDLMLPKLDGLDVLKYIREDAGLNATPVMILSNAFMDERSAKAMTAGATKRLLKTQCTPAKLIEAVRESLGMPPGIRADLNSGDPQTNSGLAVVNEAMFKQVREGFLKDAPAEVSKIRDHCLAFVKTSGTPANAEHLQQLYQQVRFLGARASLGDCTKIAHLSSVLEAMLFEAVFEKPAASPSVLQTIAQAVDCLGRLLLGDNMCSTESALQAKVLIVDDDPVCNFATAAAMKRAKLEAVSTQDSAAALQLAGATHYDIVLLDINMPGLNGFELCEKIRLLPGYQKTPVIFVTSNSEFQNRAKAVLSGGNDLIAKPISPLELALKTIMHLIAPRENPRVAKPKMEKKTPSPVSMTAEKIEIHTNGVSPGESENAGTKTELPAEPGNAPRKSEAGTDVAAPVESVAPVTPADSSPLMKGSPDAKHSDPENFIPELPPMNHINAPLNGANRRSIMKNQNESNESFKQLVRDVARIIFGDSAQSEMNLRLTDIALERYNVHELLSRTPDAAARANGSKAEAEAFDQIVRQVTRIIFGDDGFSDMHLRLTRIALERRPVAEIIGHLPETNGRNGSLTVPSLAVSA